MTPNLGAGRTCAFRDRRLHAGVLQSSQDLTGEGETASWESREGRKSAFNIQADFRVIGLARELRGSAPTARACFW